MILAVTPIDKSKLTILYVCTLKDIVTIMKEAESFDIEYMSSDDGVYAEKNDPFLLSLIYPN